MGIIKKLCMALQDQIESVHFRGSGDLIEGICALSDLKELGFVATSFTSMIVALCSLSNLKMDNVERLTLGAMTRSDDTVTMDDVGTLSKRIKLTKVEVDTI